MVLTTMQLLSRDHVVAHEVQPKMSAEIEEFNRQTAEDELLNSLFGLQSSTIDLDNYVNNDSVIKLTSAVNGFFLTSVKKKSGDDLEEEDNNAGNET